ncbi:DoxX family protein [Patescibacteria group bacterium]|nr:DoxX family protein [Patescibacteria group bacterium]
MTKKYKHYKLTKMLTGILFLFTGLSKLFTMTPSGFAENMLVPVFGIGMGFALFLAWVVIVFEVLGGVALVSGCKFPKKFYTWLVWGLVVIMLVAVLFVHAPNKDFLNLLKDLIIASVLVSAVKGCCKKKYCTDGSCKGCKGGKCEGGKCCEDGTCK